MRRYFFTLVTVAAMTTTAYAQQQSNVVLDGTPAVSDALKERIGPYLDSRYAEIASVADDGSAMLIATRFAETSQIHMVRMPLGMRRQLTFRQDSVSSAQFMPGSNTVLIYQSDKGGNENHQLYRLDITAASTTMLTDGKSRNLDYRWTHKGDRVIFTSNARNGKDMDFWMADGTGGQKAELFLERAGHWELLDISRDDKLLLIRKVISIEDSQLHVVNVATKAVTMLTPEQPKGSYRTAAFGPGAKSVFAATDCDGDFVELYELELKGDAPGASKPLSHHIPWSVERLALSPDEKTLAFVTNEGGISVMHLLDTKTKKEKVEPSIPRGVIGNFRFGRKSPLLAMSITSPARTGDVYTFDVAKKKVVRWTESEIGGLNADTLVEPTLIEYTSFDGKKIPAFYFEPKTGGPFPVMIDIHGGPETQARPWFTPFRQFWVTQLGVAVLVPNVRGSDGYGKTYLSLDNGFKRSDSVKDIGALLDWIAKNPKLDAQRVGVFGASYGGFMVLATLAEYGDRVRAGIDMVGISNFVTFLEKTSEYRRDLRRVEYGDERDPKMREYLTQISPTTSASKIKSRLFVAQGANDPRVPAPESDQIVKAVRAQKQDVWYMLAKNEGHGFSQKENRDLFAYLATMFIEKNLIAK